MPTMIPRPPRAASASSTRAAIRSLPRDGEGGLEPESYRAVRRNVGHYDRGQLLRESRT